MAKGGNPGEGRAEGPATPGRPANHGRSAPLGRPARPGAQLRPSFLLRAVHAVHVIDPRDFPGECPRGHRKDRHISNPWEKAHLRALTVETATEGRSTPSVEYRKAERGIGAGRPAIPGRPAKLILLQPS